MYVSILNEGVSAFTRNKPVFVFRGFPEAGFKLPTHAKIQYL